MHFAKIRVVDCSIGVNSIAGPPQGRDTVTPAAFKSGIVFLYINKINVMAINLIDTIQHNLGYPALEKIDPNRQEPKNENGSAFKHELGQAAIPAVLAGLFKLSQSEEGASQIASADPDAGALQMIFERKEDVAVEKVSRYTGTPVDQVRISMERIAAEAVKLVQEGVKDNPAPDKVKALLGDQRHNILVYLPAAMQMGYLLGDNTLDDRTNKMEGPISSFMHKIEDKLAGKDT
jgi:hypothetical protein